MSCDAHLFKQYQHFNSQNYIVVTPYRHSVWTVLNLWPLPKDTLCQVWLKIGPMATHGRRHISSFRKKWCSFLFEKKQNKLCQVEFSGKEDCFLNSSIYFSCFIIKLLYIYSVYLPLGEKYDPPLNKHLLKDTVLILQGPIILDKKCKMNKRHK